MLTRFRQFRKIVGHWIHALEIDPHNSDHFLYATGATVYGSKNLASWDGPANKFKLQSLSVGIEETAVLDLTSPPTGPSLLSAAGDLGGWVHTNLDAAPLKNHKWVTMVGVDYAGNAPNIFSRGRDSIDISTNSGVNWTTIPGNPGWGQGKHVLSADGKVVIWQAAGGTHRSVNGAAFVPTSGIPGDAHLASDKRNASLIYAAQGNTFYVSTDAGASFSAAGTFASSGTAREINVNPYTAGDVWLAADNGVYHSVSPFTSWTKIADIASALNLGLGAPKPGTSYPSIYVAGYANPDWTQGLYRSDDQGVNWVKTNDNTKNGFANMGPVAGE
jgi:xyloglucan-specific exo-beta-1,4-glucanase